MTRFSPRLILYGLSWLSVGVSAMMRMVRVMSEGCRLLLTSRIVEAVVEKRFDVIQCDLFS
jgi:hypothetical protein